MRLKRCGPALLYVVATMLVQCVHDHRGAAEPAARCEASCADTRTHLSGHPAPDLGHEAGECLACQFRSEHLTWLLSPPTFLRPGASVAVVEATPLAFPRRLRRVSCRAPPRV